LASLNVAGEVLENPRTWFHQVDVLCGDAGVDALIFADEIIEQTSDLFLTLLPGHTFAVEVFAGYERRRLLHQVPDGFCVFFLVGPCSDFGVLQIGEAPQLQQLEMAGQRFQLFTM